ncbi:hypothetical protein ACFXJ6_19875 [Streptomyces sp. NPDC059218]|uniref:hypothetical protein n=1 Tax=unclassified Streptomyces TaxID=2593676 RepID=UPI0036AD75A5
MRRDRAAADPTVQSSGRRTALLNAITTVTDVNDVTQPLALVDGIPPVAGKPWPTA